MAASPPYLLRDGPPWRCADHLRGSTFRGFAHRHAPLASCSSRVTWKCWLRRNGHQKKVVLISTGCSEPSISPLGWPPSEVHRAPPEGFHLWRLSTQRNVGGLHSRCGFSLSQGHLEMLLRQNGHQSSDIVLKKKKYKPWQLALHISSVMDPPGSAQTTRRIPFFVALRRGMSADAVCVASAGGGRGSRRNFSPFQGYFILF